MISGKFDSKYMNIKRILFYKISLKSLFRFSVISVITFLLLFYIYAFFKFKPPKINKDPNFKPNPNIIIDSVNYYFSGDTYNPYNVGKFNGDYLMAIDALYIENKLVYFVSTQHIAEDSYYKTLQNKFFNRSDVVLYECIDIRVDKENLGYKTAKNLFQALINFSKLLGLTSQGDAFNYENLPNNWVHADIEITTSSEYFKRIFEKDYYLSLFIRYIVIPFYHSQKFFYCLIGKKIEYESAIRHYFMKEKVVPFSYPERDEKLLSKLDEIIKMDKYNTISIFYGAAHSGSLIKKINSRYDAKPFKRYWLVYCKEQSLIE